jgi:hypothetical protein
LGFQICRFTLDGCYLNSQFLDLASGNGSARGYIEVERRDHGHADDNEQKDTNPLTLHAPGGLSVSMDNLSSLSLHNDLFLWAMVD